MRTKKITVAVALTLALAACKKDEKGAATEDKPKEPATTPADPKAPPVTPPTDEKPAPTAAPGDSLTLTFPTPTVGTKWSEEQTQSMDLTITADGETGQLRQETIEKKQVEVLAVTDNAVTKAKYTYDVSESQTMGGKTQARPAPHSGKTYILEASNGKVTVTADGGGAASAAEVELVTKAEDSFGKADRMATLLAGRTFKKGEAVDLPADAISDVMGGGDGMKVTKMTLVYTGVTGSDPNFDMTLSMVQDKPDMKLEIDAAGKVTVDLASGLPLAMTMEGPVKMSGKISATGTMKVVGTRSRR